MLLFTTIVTAEESKYKDQPQDEIITVTPGQPNPETDNEGTEGEEADDQSQEPEQEDNVQTPETSDPAISDGAASGEQLDVQVLLDEMAETTETARYIVKYKNNANGQAGKEIDIKQLMKDKYKDKIKEVNEKKALKNNFSVIEIEGSINADELINGLGQDIQGSNIEYIQPDYSLNLESNDPYYDKQWAIYDKQGSEQKQEAAESDAADEQAEDQAEAADQQVAPAEEEAVESIITPLCPQELDMIRDLPEITIEGVQMVLGRQVEPNEIEELKIIMEDPNALLFQDQASQTDTAQTNEENPNYLDVININTNEAWKTTKGNGAVIAVIDSGVDTTHEDLAANIWTNSAEIPGNGIDDDGNGYIDDVLGGWNFIDNNNTVYDSENAAQEEHGTHIAGIAAAVTDNELGIAGAAPEAKIMVLKVFKDGKAYTSDIIEAIQYAEEVGARIVNCSFGTNEKNEALEETIKTSDMLFICAAGNNAADLGEAPTYPSACEADNIISVAAINKEGQLSSFSNYSETLVDVAAPGEEIYSTLPGNQYDYGSGTSMAAAYVSAEAALLLGTDAEMTLSEVKERIINCTDRLSSLIGKVNNAGKINCGSAVKDIVNTEMIQKTTTAEELEQVTATPVPSDFTLLEVDASQYKKMSAGYYHTLYVKSDGTVWAWGNNSYGQLGDGTTTSKSIPVQVSGLSNVVEASAGGYYSIALKSDGTVWTWGYNKYGQLGDGTTTNRSIPVQVIGLSNVVAVAAGYSHSIALKSDGTVWTWGYNAYGQLGDGTLISKNTPVQVIGLSGAAAVAAGYYHSIALKSDETVCAWGYNKYGQLGNGTTTNSSLPVQVIGLSNVVAVTAGSYHNISVKSDETVWSWGYNNYGQLGDGTTTNRTTPVQVSGLGSVISATAGQYHSMTLKSDGTVWTWGYNYYGQLGDGTFTNKNTPVQSIVLSDVAAVATGCAHSIAVNNNGTVWTWGYNSYGQLGDASSINRTIFMQANGLSDIVSVAACNKHSIALNNDGTVWAWGYNNYGQLGDGTTISKRIPVQVIGLSNVAAIATGYGHSIALKEDGTVWTWGYNEYGQLGDGTTISKYTPVKVSGLSDVVAVAAGKYHSMALKSDGTVWTWGYNNCGQLGNNTTVSKSIPVQVFNLIGSALKAVAIVAGSDHCLALSSDGTVQAWGSNYYGQLGNTSIATYIITLEYIAYSVQTISIGTTTPIITYTKTPLLVSKLSGIVAIAAEDTNCIALKNDGTVWTWGLNTHESVPVDEMAYNIIPYQVSGLTGVVAVDVGSCYNFAQKNDGTVWTWGDNNSGQLGDGTTTRRLAPVQAIGLSNIIGMAGGYSHSIMVDEFGNVYTCGDNTYYQLAAESYIVYRSVPIDDVSYSLNKTTQTLTLSIPTDAVFDLVLSGKNMKKTYFRRYTLEYDPNQIELVDLCAMTETEEKAVETIVGAGIYVVQCDNGKIVFITTDNTLEAGEVWSGIINSLRFKSKTSTAITVTVSYQ